MRRSRRANDERSLSWSGSVPYRLRARGRPPSERCALGLAPMRSCAPRLIQRVSPSAIRSATCGGVGGEHPRQVPTGQGEHAGLERVVHRQQQVDALDPLHVLVGHGVRVGDPEDGADRRCGRAGDAVGGERPVVGDVGSGERRGELAADADGQLAACDLLPAVGEHVVAMAGGEVHELMGELVVVLQRVHERGRVDPELAAPGSSSAAGTRCRPWPARGGRRGG